MTITVRDIYSQIADPARPLLTWYDDATGERTELSTATLANWTAKAANLLVMGLGLGPGDTFSLRLPPHWQTAAVLLGCWSAGLTQDENNTQVGFSTVDSLNTIDADDVFAVSLHPFAMPIRDLPAGISDWALTARQHGDFFSGYQPVALMDVDLATQRAAELNIQRGHRVLIDTDAHPDPLTWLLAPLVAGASVVLVRNQDPSKLDARLAAELATLVG